jgi:hypothetical protein
MSEHTGRGRGMRPNTGRGGVEGIFQRSYGKTVWLELYRMYIIRTNYLFLLAHLVSHTGIRCIRSKSENFLLCIGVTVCSQPTGLPRSCCALWRGVV